LQCVALCCSILCILSSWPVLQCVAVCCSILQCVAVCCSVLPCIAVCCSVLPCVAVCCSILCHLSSWSVLQYVAVCCSVLQYVAVCCSVLQHSLPPFILTCDILYHMWMSRVMYQWTMTYVWIKIVMPESCVNESCYGVAAISRLPKITGLFGEYRSLL